MPECEFCFWIDPDTGICRNTTNTICQKIVRGIIMEIKRKPEFQNSKGVDALERLMQIALRDSHQCKYVRDFLLHLYNSKNPVDLIAILQAVDTAITQDCLTVIVMRARERREPHNYFENGSKIFQHLQKLNNTSA